MAVVVTSGAGVGVPRLAKPNVVVIGGGVGGLTIATRLADSGHCVTVLERRDQVGGKLAVVHRDGFTFDIGPSLLTLPQVFDQRVLDQLTLVRLDPQFRYRWADGHEMTMTDPHGLQGFGSTSTGPDSPVSQPATADADLARFRQRGKRIWEISERTFLAGPMGVRALRRMRSPRELLTIDPFHTLAQVAEKDFDDPRMVQWAGRYATYSGSSPYRAPATLSCIAHIEAEYGCWYAQGGLGSLRDAVRNVAVQAGVTIVTGADVQRITTADRRVNGVEFTHQSSVTKLEAGIVVANCDAEVLYRDLLPLPKALRRVRRAERSTSGFAICAAVSGQTPGIAHHNVWFSTDYRSEFDTLDSGQLAADPTIYACISSVSDDSQAPAGHENWFILVNTPPGVTVDAEQYQQIVLDRLAEHGTDLRQRLLFTETMTPADIQARYGSLGGALYGSSSNGRRAAFLRPSNRGAIPGLYLVGGSSHPGGGLPMVTISARIVADMIRQDVS